MTDEPLRTMAILPRQLPPAGTPIGFADLSAAFRGLLDPEEARRQLVSLVQRATGARHCILVGSGRTAAWLLLEAMKRHAAEGRDKVLLPSYTCASLPSAVARAGLVPVPVRVDEATLDYQPAALAEALARHAPLAVFAVNLFGMPGDSPRWAAMARAAGALFVDDAAQTLGSSCAGRPSGRWGDAGFYSLARGKNITAMGGGILVTDDDRLAAVIADNLPDLTTIDLRREIRTLVEAIGFWLLLRPRLFWLAGHLPGVRLQVFEFNPGFPTRRMGGVQAALARRSWRRLHEANARRRINGQRLRAALADIPGVRIPTPSCGFASWLRLPIVFATSRDRDRAAAALAERGLGSAIVYPVAWGRLEGCPVPPGAAASEQNELPSRLLALATHHAVEPPDIVAVREVLARILT